MIGMNMTPLSIVQAVRACMGVCQHAHTKARFPAAKFTKGSLKSLLCQQHKYSSTVLDLKGEFADICCHALFSFNHELSGQKVTEFSIKRGP